MFFENLFRKIQVSSKCDKNKGRCTRRPLYIYHHISVSSPWNETCFRRNTHFMFNNFSPRKSWRLWHNEEKYGRARETTDDSIIRCMRLACWITKATDTLRICDICCFSAALMVAGTRFNITLNVHCLFCLFYVHQKCTVCVCVCVFCAKTFSKFGYVACAWPA